MSSHFQGQRLASQNVEMQMPHGLTGIAAAVGYHTVAAGESLRRRDGMWAYQFAVAVDDALMGVTEVVRGDDLLLSTAPQRYLQRLLGLPQPERYVHLPLLRNAAGQRLSKRDGSLSLAALRPIHSPEAVLAKVLTAANLPATLLHTL